MFANESSDKCSTSLPITKKCEANFLFFIIDRFLKTVLIFLVECYGGYHLLSSFSFRWKA